MSLPVLESEDTYVQNPHRPMESKTVEDCDRIALLRLYSSYHAVTFADYDPYADYRCTEETQIRTFMRTGAKK